MKKLLLGLLLISSTCVFAANSFETMPQGALKNGTLKSGRYKFLKYTYKDIDGWNVRPDEKVLVDIKNLKQEKNTFFTQYFGQSGSENLGRATDIQTSLDIHVREGSKNYSCHLTSTNLSDGMDLIGFDDTELTCTITSKTRNLKIILTDYSDTKDSYNEPKYEIFVHTFKRGLLKNSEVDFYTVIKSD